MEAGQPKKKPAKAEDHSESMVLWTTVSPWFSDIHSHLGYGIEKELGAREGGEW